MTDELKNTETILGVWKLTTEIIENRRESYEHIIRKEHTLIHIPSNKVVIRLNGYWHATAVGDYFGGEEYVCFSDDEDGLYLLCDMYDYVHKVKVYKVSDFLV
jgi:hypothetical protein